MSEHYDQVIQHTANKTYLEPCLNIENLQIDYTERDVPSLEVNSDDGGEGWFEIQFTILTNTFAIWANTDYSVETICARFENRSDNEGL